MSTNAKYPSGGVTVKASDLVLGDYIRDPRKAKRIMQVQELGTQIYAICITEAKKHIFLNRNQFVTKVTDVTTENLEI